jgi:hypothetical protein
MLKKILLIIAGLAVLTAGLIWVWHLDDPGGSQKITKIKGEEFFSVRLNQDQGADIIIQCNEDDYQSVFAAFRKSLKINSEPLALTGGPLLLTAFTELPEQLSPLKRAAIEFLKRHSPRRIVLIGHDNCLVYDMINAWQGETGKTTADPLSDLNKAEQTVKEWFPTAVVESYFAKQQGNRLDFVPLSKIPTKGGVQQ